MIPRIPISDAGHHAGETVEIAGWLYNLRRSGKIAFPIVRDGSGTMQCVAVKSALPEELFETVKNLTQESSIIVERETARGTARGGRRRDGRREPAKCCSVCRNRTRTRSRPRNTAPIS